MAIEDAVLLAEFLGKPGDLTQALERFALRRLSRCKLVMEVGLQLGAWENAEWSGHRAPTPTTAVYCTVRSPAHAANLRGHDHAAGNTRKRRHRNAGKRRPVHRRRARSRPADRLATTLSDVGNRGSASMSRQFIDLSIFLENDVVSDPPLYRPHIDYIDHKMSLPGSWSAFSQACDNRTCPTKKPGRSSAFN